MKCNNCKTVILQDSKFCSYCGTPIQNGQNNTFSTGGGSNNAPVTQNIAGRDLHVYPVPDNNVETPVGMYDVIPKWRSPVTQGVLTWIGATLGIIGIFPIWNIWNLFSGFINSIKSSGSPPSIDNSLLYFYLVLAMVLMVLVGLVIKLRKIARWELRKPIIFGWSISGHGKKISLEKVQVDTCPKCGGKMKYYNKPVKWVSYVDPSGKKKQRITERSPAIECRRNQKHWWEVDPAEEC